MFKRKASGADFGLTIGFQSLENFYFHKNFALQYKVFNFHPFSSTLHGRPLGLFGAFRSKYQPLPERIIQ